MRSRTIILLLVLSSLFFVTRVRAQTSTPATLPLISQYPLLGVNCGNPEDTANGTNKCCVNPVITPKLLDWGFPFDGVASWVNNALKEKINPLIEMQRQNKVEPCMHGSPTTPGDLENPACTCIIPTQSPLSAISPMCGKVSSNEQAACGACLSGSSGNVGIWTSVGCVYSDFGIFIQEKLLGWGVGFAGGISLLCIVYAAFMMQTSRGNPESIKKAQQLLTSCITGLMLIIFSVFILRLIGVSILKIPGFN